MFGLEIRKLVYNEWCILKGEVTRNRKNSPFPILHCPAKFQNSPANSPSVKMSSTDENVREIGNGKWDLTHSILTTDILKKKYYLRMIPCKDVAIFTKT